jgi:phage/plasmid-like protein (TIGR03299 family)
MAHEIEQHDNVVLHRQRAWHGLGIVVEDAPTPLEALTIAGLDWEVVPAPLLASMPDGSKVSCRGHVANVRSDLVGVDDDASILGIVSTHYQAVQNRELAEFCEALAEQDDTVRIESAGSIRNGQKLWFLLKGDSFTVGDDEDVIAPYVCVSNGHDGKTSVRATPTSVRVVCSNTLHMVIPRIDDEGRIGRKELEGRSFVCNHVGDMKGKVEEAKQALQLYGRARDEMRGGMDLLADADCTTDAFKQFFLRAYSNTVKPIAATPTTEAERRDYNKAVEGAVKCLSRFTEESDRFGGSMWTAFNAYSGWLQHDRGINYKDPTVKVERRQELSLFGIDSERTSRAFAIALSLAT